MEATPFNLCSLPPWAIASRHFNRQPQPLEIQGVRAANRLFFERLDRLEESEARARLFNDYMDVRFQLHQWQRESSAGSRKSLKNSYLRFLKGWMFDSNSIEGAVLKGWVESRLGLPPTFHRQPIDDLHGEAYQLFQIARMQGAARTSAIFPQLDLLYEFVQYELLRRGRPPHLTLFRGINDFAVPGRRGQSGGRCRHHRRHRRYAGRGLLRRGSTAARLAAEARSGDPGRNRSAGRAADPPLALERQGKTGAGGGTCMGGVHHLFQYGAFAGMIQRTPPRGSAVSPALWGIRWMCQVHHICPAAGPWFAPMLKQARM